MLQGWCLFTRRRLLFTRRWLLFTRRGLLFTRRGLLFKRRRLLFHLGLRQQEKTMGTSVLRLARPLHLSPTRRYSQHPLNRQMQQKN